MKVVILAGGKGTRLSEETVLKPKPMVEIGNKPMLWHIMKIYSHFGFDDFIICLGYKGYMIKEYFANYFLHQTDVTINLKKNTIDYYKSKAEDWRISLIDTGLATQTGGRLKRVQKYLGNETFMFTYGDGLSNVNISELLDYHKTSGKIATVTAVQPVGRFGAIDINEDNIVNEFNEKPKGDGTWINGGFFVLEPKVFDYIEGDNSYWERKPLRTITKDKQLAAYKHRDFWKPMDTLREKIELEQMWDNNNAPWKLWEDNE